MNFRIVEGDLLEQKTEGIVNSWNRNLIPWWLLLPQGVSGAIKRRAGLAPFRELGRIGSIPLGGAVHTSAGRLPFKVIIHVAGINLLWRASKLSIAQSVRNAVELAETLGLQSLAFPLVGAGAGGFKEGEAETIMVDTFSQINSSIHVIIVRFRPTLVKEPL